MNEALDVAKVELMLAGWSVTHNGGAKLTFWCNEEDLEHFKHATVKKGNTAGQRYMAALVEIGDDEQPARKPPTPLFTSAVMLCKSEEFQRFTDPQNVSQQTNNPEEHASQYIKDFCRIKSRKDLDTDSTAASYFARLMEMYRERQQ
jgi:hypothetical protein